MKKQILDIDAFTNGHEASLVLAKRQGWSSDRYSIVHCGSNANVLRQLAKGPGFAVLPVHNSTVGVITEVTETLASLRAEGYDLIERDRFDLPISHCLLVPMHINSVAELERVISHEKALAQCGRFLDGVGITVDKRSPRDSTGNAAKAISKLGPNSKIGAIAPAAAASAYGLKILARGIQDDINNRTTFVLLENEARIERKVVGIIGIGGGMGKRLESYFKDLGMLVIGSDIRNPDGPLNEDIVRLSDVVIVSVPIDKVADVIRSINPLMREDQLLMDVTSTKQPAVEAMLESRSQVVGLHPMSAPNVPFDGQTICVCPARLSVRSWKTWVVNMLSATGAEIKWTNPETHDIYMMPVQVNQHFSTLVNILLIVESGISVTESLSYTSPFYRMDFARMGRLLSKPPEMYASIMMNNPKIQTMLDLRRSIENCLAEIILRRDHQAFAKLWVKAQEHFGAETIKAADEWFNWQLSVAQTTKGKNSVILRVSKTESKPGLLTHLSTVFSRLGINLTGINSATLGDKVMFAISFEQPRLSDEVRLALEEIETWTDPRVEIVG